VRSRLIVWALLVVCTHWPTSGTLQQNVCKTFPNVSADITTAAAQLRRIAIAFRYLAKNGKNGARSKSCGN
jgi:hypothetical protein